jgi:hypothetical protein
MALVLVLGPGIPYYSPVPRAEGSNFASGAIHCALRTVVSKKNDHRD